MYSFEKTYLRHEMNYYGSIAASISKSTLKKEGTYIFNTYVSAVTNCKNQTFAHMIF